MNNYYLSNKRLNAFKSHLINTFNEILIKIDLRAKDLLNYTELYYPLLVPQAIKQKTETYTTVHPINPRMRRKIHLFLI